MLYFLNYQQFISLFDLQFTFFFFFFFINVLYIFVEPIKYQKIEKKKILHGTTPTFCYFEVCDYEKKKIG